MTAIEKGENSTGHYSDDYMQWADVLQPKDSKLEGFDRNEISAFAGHLVVAESLDYGPKRSDPDTTGFLTDEVYFSGHKIA